jgi:hypothetical protein
MSEMPKDQEAERCVLSSLMRDNGRIDDVLQTLRAENFYFDAHQTIFKAIKDIHNSGKPVDSAILASFLNDKNQLENIGGPAYLGDLWDYAPCPANAIRYAEAVLDKAKKRNLLYAGQRILDNVSKNGAPVGELLENALRDLSDLDKHSGCSKKKPKVKAIRLADVSPRKVEWIWPGRIPLGFISLLDGDPGLGKTLILLDMFARVTTGRPMPGTATSRPPANVLFLSAEDDISRTIRPRFDALGGDATRFFDAESIDLGGEDRPIALPEDIPLLEQFVVDNQIALIGIDPFSAFLGTDVDTNNDHSVRLVMHRLRQLCERTGVAIVLIRHLNKLVTVSDPMYRGGGSIAIIAAARSAFLIAKDPDNPEKSVFARIKGNLCREPEALSYEIVSTENNIPLISWIGTVELEARDLLAKGRQGNQDEGREKRNIKQWGTKLLVALDRLDPNREGRTRKDIQELSRLNGKQWAAAVQDLLEQKIIEKVPVFVRCGNGAKRKQEGFRRAEHHGT